MQRPRKHFLLRAAHTNIFVICVSLFFVCELRVDILFGAHADIKGMRRHRAPANEE
jgi:hypothetical protein